MALRNTIQRTLVCEAVRQLGCHATADEIFEAVRLLHPSISRATVYRNLNVLTDEGKIRRLAIPGGADRFDHALEPHYHARCDGCGRVFDVEMEPLNGLEAKARASGGFRLSGHDLIFHGLCADCASI